LIEEKVGVLLKYIGRFLRQSQEKKTNSPPGIFNLRSSFSQLRNMLSGAQDLSPAIAGMVEFIDASSSTS
jgi:hypothetical protein